MVAGRLPALILSSPVRAGMTTPLAPYAKEGIEDDDNNDGLQHLAYRISTVLQEDLDWLHEQEGPGSWETIKCLPVLVKIQ